MRKDLMRLHQMMTKIKNPLKNVEGEETKEDSIDDSTDDSTDEKVDPKYAEANALGVKTGDLSGMPKSTAAIVYTARMNAARNAKNNN